MMPGYGFAGKVLHVDLGTGDAFAEPLDATLAARFIGGVGDLPDAFCGTTVRIIGSHLHRVAVREKDYQLVVGERHGLVSKGRETPRPKHRTID